VRLNWSDDGTGHWEGAHNTLHVL